MAGPEQIKEVFPYKKMFYWKLNRNKNYEKRGTRIRENEFALWFPLLFKGNGLLSVSVR